MLARDTKFLGIRLAVGLIVLTALFIRLDLGNLLESAQRCLPWFLIIAALGMFANLLIAARRWKFACGKLSAGISYWRFYAWYMEAAFFNIFLPSQGGDLIRIWRMAARKNDGALAMSTVLAERVLGLAAMIIMVGIGFLCSEQEGFIPGIRRSFLIAAAASVIGFSCLLHPAFSNILIHFCIQRKWQKTADFLKKCADVFAMLAKRPWALVGIVLYSWAMQLAAIMSIYLISRAIFITIPFAYFLVAVPIVWLVVMVPVSFNGIGTREAANIVLFGAMGVPSESALLLSVIWSGQLFLIGLIGGFFHLWLTANESKIEPVKAVLDPAGRQGG